MNKRPVSYLQTDPRWKNERLNCNGGTMSIGGGGCGPTSAAMLIETLTGKRCLPAAAFRWACEHGYVYANQGTSYDYFRPQFAAYDIECDRISATACLSAKSPVRQMVLDKLKEGYYFIVLMKKGLWTNGGHYIVVWWADNKIRINDPASTKDARLNGDPDTFFSQAKYFWWVDARKHNGFGYAKKEEDMLDVTKLTDEQCYQIFQKSQAYAATLEAPQWARDGMARAKEHGVTDGTKPMCLLTRAEGAMMADRAAGNG